MIMMYHYMIRVILKQSLKQKGWNHAHLFVIDRLRACVLVDIYSWVCVRADIDRWEDRAHGFGIDWLRACVSVDIFSFACFRVDIDSWQDCTLRFGIDRLISCVHVDIGSWRAVPGLIQIWKQFYEYGIYYIYLSLIYSSISLSFIFLSIYLSCFLFIYLLAT